MLLHMGIYYAIEYILYQTPGLVPLIVHRVWIPCHTMESNQGYQKSQLYKNQFFMKNSKTF